MALHRAALLREARHVEHADALAFEMRGHAKKRADGDDASAADAGDDDVVGEAGGGQRRLGQVHPSPMPAVIPPPKGEGGSERSEEPGGALSYPSRFGLRPNHPPPSGEG